MVNTILYISKKMLKGGVKNNAGKVEAQSLAMRSRKIYPEQVGNATIL